MDLTLFINAEHKHGDDLAQRFAEHADQVRAARDVGFDGVAVGMHLSYGSSAWFPPLELLTSLAPVSSGMSLATSMLILPLFHPLHVAQQAAFLDIISGGRLILGVAPGWTEDEFNILDLNYKRRISRYVESLTLIQRLFTEREVKFEGQHFNVDGLTLSLRPMQRPRPTMWYGGSVAKAVARAADLADTSLGDSWVASSHLVGDVITKQAGVFQGRLDELGKPRPPEFPLLRNIVVADDRATALRDAGPFLEASYRIFGQWGLFTGPVGADKEQLDLEELIAGRVIIGSPEECAEQLLALREATDFTRLVARVQWLGMDQDIVLRTIRLLGERVIPIIQRARS
ncbi:MAG: Alkanesulfonate monooxygenase [Alphaproteobacteria bacterium MarineAlpha4_Bin2]|nr:MAG: Alkanesulfonate monooxygenase [Alphaproteobacteria bacterium MarineAlpha4_Bin2]